MTGTQGRTTASATSGLTGLVDGSIEFVVSVISRLYPKLVQKVDLSLLLILHSIGAFLALNKTLRWVKDLALDRQRGLPSVHAVFFILELRRRWPHPIDMLKVLFKTSDNIFCQLIFLLFVGLELLVEDLLRLNFLEKCALLLFNTL